MELTAIELKFLVRLLAHDAYRTRISQIKPNAKTSARDRDRVCMQLCSKGLVDYTHEIVQFGLTPAGRTLLNLGTTSLPVTPDELYTLKAAEHQPVVPGKIKRVSSRDRQRIICNLEDRGLLKVKKTQLKEVWLTQQGKLYLRDQCCPSGAQPALSLSMLANYLTFLRQTLVTAQTGAGLGEGQPTNARGGDPEISAEDVLSTIQQLDQTLSKDNYLPIFHLRDKLEPPLSRAALDQMLYELQRRDRIEISTLQDVSAYSETQLAAGIAQDIGGALFFISVI